MQDGYEYTSVFKGDTKTNRDWWNERHMPCRAGNLYSSPTVCCYKREFLIFQDKSEIKIFKWNLKMILRQLLIQNISICLCRSPSSYLQSERWTSPYVSLWTFEDRHWIPRDIFSSRSNATTFINSLVYKCSKCLTILNGFLTCSDLLKKKKNFLKCKIERGIKNLTEALTGWMGQLFYGCTASFLLGSSSKTLCV